MQFNKHTYLNGFTFIVIILALGRCGYDYTHKNDAAVPADSLATTVDGKVPVAKMNYDFSNPPSFKSIKDMPHRVYSVPDFSNTFPDENDVQLIAADENGVRPPKNRAEAERRMEDLVFVGANPYFYIDNLKQSMTEYENSFLLQQLREVELGNLTKDELARKLGISRSSLYRRISRLKK